MKDLPEHILCSAIWYQDGKKYAHQPFNIESGVVVCGLRHCNCYGVLAGLVGESYDVKLTHNQGFLTSKNRFVDRKEAAEIAFKIKQITFETKGLFSEDLW